MECPILISTDSHPDIDGKRRSGNALTSAQAIKPFFNQEAEIIS
jgi:hypothetical protein